MNVDIAIVFVGLIIQVNQPWSFDNTAVLPYLDTHKAEMVIEARALQDAAPLMAIPSVTVNDDGQVIIPLKNVDVRLRGTRGMFNRRNREYQESIPSLRKLGGCGRLRDEIRNRNQGSDAEKFVSFIDLRGGRMVPHSYLEKKLKFADTDFVDRCAACSILYEAAFRRDTATLLFTYGSNQPIPVTVNKGAEILVRNVPTEEVDDHFIHNYVIYETCPGFKLPVRTTPCRKPQCESEFFDWENSGFPSYPPTTDCTGTDG